MRYELSRDSLAKDRHILCREDEFYTLVPQAVRQRGPWQVLSRGYIEELKPEYRLELAHQGWLYIEAYPVGFSVKA